MTEKKKTLSEAVPWKVRLALFAVGTFSDFSRRSDGTINRLLMGFLDSPGKVPPQSRKGVKISDITVDSSRNVWFRLFIPTDVHGDHEKLPLFVFFHGGGFSFLSPDAKAYHVVCCKFAAKIPAVVISVNYRLSPEHKFPAPYDDGFDTLKFIQSNKDLFTNADLSRCFLAGDSAGANLAHHVARRVAENEAAFTELKVVGLISIQPFFGGEERTESEIRLTRSPLITVERTDWHWKVFLPEGENRDHEAANVFGPKYTDISGLKGFPPTLLFVGGFDPLQDWQKRYFEGLKKSGITVKLVEYPHAIHAFYSLRSRL